MNHLIMAPLLIPLLTGALIALGANRPVAHQRAMGLAGCLASLLVCVILLYQSVTGPIQMYALGNWPPPFGIVMVLDRLSAMMIGITSMLALPCLFYACHGTDLRGKNFHALFQFQLLGIAGAFLTGDIFNLFVFFEIMLLASYGLVLHGGGAFRIRAGMQYAILNLVGSSIFLVGVGILYGILGTLNMADLALRVSRAPLADAALIQAGGLILFGVFALKAALLPLCFWLPDAYGFTSAAVAALFAVMTKVGVYVILRVYTLIFGIHGGGAAQVLTPWLLPLALVTLAAGTLGVIASQDLRRIIAWMVVMSVGSVLAVIGTFETQAVAAAIVYLPHTTLVTAGMFLVADMIQSQRSEAGARLRPDLPVAQPQFLGLLYLAAAVALVGLPPLSGFTAKVMMLMSVQHSPASAWIWSLMLLGGFMGLIALGRAGTVIFWKILPGDPAPRTATSGTPVTRALPALVLLGASPLMVLFGGPITEFAHRAAEELVDPIPYIQAVLGAASTGGL